MDPIAKGKGKGGDKGKVPPPPVASGYSAAKAKQLAKEKMEKERQERSAVQAREKEIREKQEELRVKLPSVMPCDYGQIDWSQALSTLHLAGGAGEATGVAWFSSKGGVKVVEFEGNKAVCLRRTPNVVAEDVSQHLAGLLGVTVARSRIVRGDEAEGKDIRSMEQRLDPNFEAWSVHFDPEKIQAAMEKSDPEMAKKLKDQLNGTRSTVVVLEFVPGKGLDESKDALTPDLMNELGRMTAFDTLLNNFDRVPIPVWDENNKGNLSNAIVLPGGQHVVAIDQQVYPVHDALNRKEYLGRVRRLARQLSIVPDVSDTDGLANLSRRIYSTFHASGAHLEDESLEGFLNGLREGLRSIAEVWTSGALEKALQDAEGKVDGRTAGTISDVAGGGGATFAECRDFVLLVAAEVAHAVNGSSDDDQIAGTTSTRKVLIVCTGNTCRSPMAHYYLVHCAQQKRSRLTFFSRGVAVRAEEGKVNPHAVEVLSADDIGLIAQHESKQISEADVEDAHLIIVMTRSHRDRLIGLVPAAAEKVRLLQSFVGKSDEHINDPFGMSLDEYKKCFESMKPALDKIVELNGALS